MIEFIQGFKAGLAQGWRGYFAPLRPSPWRAAFNAAKDPGARWFTPFSVWFNEVERIIKGK